MPLASAEMVAGPTPTAVTCPERSIVATGGASPGQWGTAVFPTSDAAVNVSVLPTRSSSLPAIVMRVTSGTAGAVGVEEAPPPHPVASARQTSHHLFMTPPIGAIVAPRASRGVTSVVGHKIRWVP